MPMAYTVEPHEGQNMLIELAIRAVSKIAKAYANTFKIMKSITQPLKANKLLSKLSKPPLTKEWGRVASCIFKILALKVGHLKVKKLLLRLPQQPPKEQIMIICQIY